MIGSGQPISPVSALLRAKLRIMPNRHKPGVDNEAASEEQHYSVPARKPDTEGPGHMIGRLRLHPHQLLSKMTTAVKRRFVTASLVAATLMLLGCLGIGYLYLKQQDTRTALASQLQVSRAMLARLGSAESRQENMAAAQSMLVGNQTLIPVGRTNTAVVNEVLKVAQESRVQIDQVEAHPAKAKKVNNSTFTVLSVNVVTRGTISQIEAFLHDVESGGVKAAVVERVTISSIYDSPIASISIVAYSRN
jgi:hypothetical protein